MLECAASRISGETPKDDHDDRGDRGDGDGLRAADDRQVSAFDVFWFLLAVVDNLAEAISWCVT